jgi:hypothetical protein
MNDKTEINYKFLFEPLLKWFRYNWGFAFEDNLPALSDFEKENFNKIFIEPYINRSKEDLKLISKYQTNYIFETYGKQIFFNVSIEEKPSYFKAIDWVMVNIKELNLEGLNFSYEYHYDDVMEEFYREPYKQCRCCGRLDKDTRTNTKNNTFNNKSKFCHLNDCELTSLNPNDHEEGCCYREWKIIKKHLKQKFKRIMLNKKSSRNEKEKTITDLFIQFCNDRLEHNKSIENEVRVDFEID